MDTRDPPNLFEDDALVERIAKREGWHQNNWRMWRRTKDLLLALRTPEGKKRVTDAFLVPGGDVETATSVASWPEYVTEPIVIGPTPILDAIVRVGVILGVDHAHWPVVGPDEPGETRYPPTPKE